MKKLLQRCYFFFSRKRWLFVSLLLIGTALMIAAALQLRIEEDVTRLLPNGKEAGQVNALLKEAHFTERLIVKISSSKKSTEEVIAAADQLDSLLTNHQPPLVKAIKGTIADDAVLDIYETLLQHLPVFLDSADYSAIDTLITPSVLNNTLDANYRTLASASGIGLKRFIANDPSGIANLALKKMNRLQVDEHYSLYDGHIVSRDEHSAFLFIQPAFPANQTANNQPLIQLLDARAKAASDQGMHLYYYGGTAVAAGNASQLKADTILTLSLTISGLLIFIWITFRRKRIPLVMMLPLVLGGLWALAIIALTKGSISTIALAAGSVVMGIAINYSVHFFIHYRHCRSIPETIAELLLPLSIGNITTVGSFFSLLLVKSPLLNDFGLFAGLSLLGAAGATLLVLPHFIPSEINEERDHTPRWLTWLATVEFKRPAIVFLIILGLTFFFASQIKNVKIDGDLNALNYQSPTLKQSEKEIQTFNSDSSKTVFVASTGKTINEALLHAEALNHALDALQQQQKIQRYASVSAFLPSVEKQQQKINQWNIYWQSHRNNFVSAMHQLGQEKGFSSAAFSNFDELYSKNYYPLPFDSFVSIKNAIADEYLIGSTTSSKQAILTAIQIEKKQRSAVYQQLALVPGTVILDKQIITNSFMADIYTDFNSILLYTSVLVFVALSLSYGRIELALITFLPMIISWIWILGIMSLAGIHFNLINIILSTFIFGIGDDFAIFITDGLLGKYKTGKDTITSHKVAIVIAAITTLMGLGVLIVAKHPALHDLAITSVIGITCVVFIGRTVQPFLFNYYLQHRADQGLPPYTLWRFIVTFVTYSWFVVGSLVVGVIGFVLFRTMHLPGIKRRKRHFHRLIQLGVKITVYLPPYVRKRYINREFMDFSKPAIIIANHASILDILTTVMQHPKIILLTNRWVYYSPVFGRVVQLADYYPVMEGAEPATDKLRDIMNDGYSIVIFPEGTRSTDGKMNRFHKGAFYLAEKLQADIVPLLLHGHHDVIPKGDFQVFPGTLTMKYLPRIGATDTSFGSGYAERTKRISKYFKQEFEQLKTELRTPDYFETKLVNNFIYKGPVLEWYTRRKIKVEKLYQRYHEVLPKKGHIVDLGCGYGFMAYMLHFLSEQRQITAVDYDEEKISMAQNTFSKHRNVQFIHQSLLAFHYPKAQGYVISDVLHYLNYNEQDWVLKQCAAALLPGGVLIVKDGDRDHEKQQMTAWSEFFSTHFGFNRMMHQEMYFTSESEMRQRAEKLGLTFEIIEKPGVSSNTIFALRKPVVQEPLSSEHE
ncbi:MAG: 1-acyl-sn-glycerol-3-phosphate acyltransferase [Chitinophagales bacterium]